MHRIFVETASEHTKHKVQIMQILSFTVISAVNLIEMLQFLQCSGTALYIGVLFPINGITELVNPLRSDFSCFSLLQI